MLVYFVIFAYERTDMVLAFLATIEGSRLVSRTRFKCVTVIGLRSILEALLRYYLKTLNIIIHFSTSMIPIEQLSRCVS